MPTPDPLQFIQGYAARAAIGASTARGQGAGVVGAARAYCATLELGRFATPVARQFRLEVDAATQKLCEAMPKPTRSFGMARKLLNVFLRQALYTTVLCEHYKLHRAEGLFELPLDSITAKHLLSTGEGQGLPRWEGVKRVDAEQNAEYQAAAAAVARRLHFARVHLDAYWWGTRPALSAT